MWLAVFLPPPASGLPALASPPDQRQTTDDGQQTGFGHSSFVIVHCSLFIARLVSLYGHGGFDVLVKPGDRIARGQKIGTEGLSCAEENGGYGSHLHFGIGDGPFRRPKKLSKGDKYEVEVDGKKLAGRIICFGYSTKDTNSTGFPRLTAVVGLEGDKTVEVVLPDESLQDEVAWMQAYIKDCKGWLNPETWLPEHVEKKK